MRAALACLLAPALALAATAPRGRVTGVSAKRAYLDAGRKQGLASGQQIQLQRNGRNIASCKIDQLADKESACPTALARVGDTFALPSAPAAQSAPAPLPPPPTASELNAAAGVLASAPVEKVDFKGATGALSRSGATLFSASVGHLAFVNFATGRDWQQERVELQLNGLDIRWAGFRAYAHIVALFNAVAPADRRFRPGDVAQVNVWELALSSREVGRSYTVSVGRIWPHHAPGLALIDGLQAGWRARDGTAEVGVYGGTIPNATTLYPQAPWTAGLYYGHTLARGRKSALRLLQTEGRLGVRGTGPGPQLELEWAMLADFARVVDLGAQARVSIGAGDWSRVSFDAARVTLGIRAYEKLRITASFRYLGPVVADYDNFAAGLFSTQRAYHGTLDLIWDPRPWIAVSLMGGTDWEMDTGNGREYFGPELSFPRLFRQRGGISVGYREELGWWAGRQAYVTFRGDLDDRFHLLARLSYFEDRMTGGFSDPALRELGIFVFADIRALRWLLIRVSAMARTGVDGYLGSNPVGLNGRIELVGTL